MCSFNCCVVISVVLIVLIGLASTLTIPQVWAYAKETWTIISNIFMATNEVSKEVLRTRRSTGNEHTHLHDAQNTPSQLKILLIAAEVTYVIIFGPIFVLCVADAVRSIIRFIKDYTTSKSNSGTQNIQNMTSKVTLMEVTSV